MTQPPWYPNHGPIPDESPAALQEAALRVAAIRTAAGRDVPKPLWADLLGAAPDITCGACTQCYVDHARGRE